MTHLEWSDSIGKRVHTGIWAEQARPTLDKVRALLEEATLPRGKTGNGKRDSRSS